MIYIVNIVFENGLLRVAQIFTDRLVAKEICLEDVCVTKEELKRLLENNQITNYSNSSNSPNQTPIPESSNDQIANTASSSEQTTEPAPSPESMQAEDLTPTPEATPTPTPSPSDGSGSPAPTEPPTTPTPEI